MNTFFALVNIPKAQQKGTANISKRGLATDNQARGQVEAVPQPPYTSATALTSAIASGTYNSSVLGAANSMYAKIGKWEKYQKYQAWVEAGRPKRRGGVAKPVDSGAYNSTFQFTKRA